jgi:hypothetical protein
VWTYLYRTGSEGWLGLGGGYPGLRGDEAELERCCSGRGGGEDVWDIAATAQPTTTRSTRHHYRQSTFPEEKYPHYRSGTTRQCRVLGPPPGTPVICDAKLRCEILPCSPFISRGLGCWKIESQTQRRRSGLLIKCVELKEREEPAEKEGPPLAPLSHQSCAIVSSTNFKHERQV